MERQWKAMERQWKEFREWKEILFDQADWVKFREVCEGIMGEININQETEQLNQYISGAIIEAAVQSIPRRTGNKKKRIVLWWTEECGRVVKERNKAFKRLKRTLNFGELIRYRKTQACVRRTVKTAKRKYWRMFCNTVGRETGIDKVWGMVRKMNGIRRVQIPNINN